MIRSLFVLILLLAACGSAPDPTEPASTSAQPQKSSFVPSGQTITPENAKRHKLGRTTRQAVAIQPGYQLKVPKDDQVVMHLANFNRQPISVSISGAEPAKAKISPGGWQRVKVKATQSDLALSWEGGELMLAETYTHPRNPGPARILLISVDTLRADHFTAEKMPRTYALFQNGIILSKMYTPTPWTLPSHASMLTGLYPGRHGVRMPDQVMSEEVVTMAETLRDKGFYNVGYTEGNYVSATYGLDQGFHKYLENPPSMLDTDISSLSKLEGTIEAFKQDLPHLGDHSLFVFLHSYEVHCPYIPRGGLSDEEGIGLTQWLLDNDGKDLKEAQLEKLKQLYAGEVAYVDDLLADLIESLPNGWCVSLTSDHGEEFGEHGGLLHADHLYEETMRVPFASMIVGMESESDGPIIVDTPASLVDIPAILFTLIGLPLPEHWQGVDPFDPDLKRESIFGESFYFGPQIPAKDPSVLGIWQDDHKLMHTQNFGESTFELYNLSTDPMERKNLQEDDVRTRNALFKSLKAYRNEEGLRSRKLDELTEEQINTMRSLGYIK